MTSAGTAQRTRFLPGWRYGRRVRNLLGAVVVFGVLSVGVIRFGVAVGPEDGPPAAAAVAPSVAPPAAASSATAKSFWEADEPPMPPVLGTSLPPMPPSGVSPRSPVRPVRWDAPWDEASPASATPPSSNSPAANPSAVPPSQSSLQASNPSSSAASEAPKSTAGERLRQLLSRPAARTSNAPATSEGSRVARPRSEQGEYRDVRESDDANEARETSADGRNERVRIPLGGGAVDRDRVNIKQQDGRLTLSVRDMPINRLMLILGQHLNLSIICSDNVSTPVSLTIHQAPFEQVLDAICGIGSCTWVDRNGIIFVTSTSGGARMPGDIQGREVRIYRLTYVAAADAEAAIKGLLSPIGQSYITQEKSSDNKRTQEMIVVHDLPSQFKAIAQYLSQFDRAPRQVMIEAHVLAVSLTSSNNWGVDFNSLFNQARGAGFKTTGFADVNAKEGFIFTFNSHDLKVVLEALKTQANSKTLGSPKLMALHGQEAHIQIGQQLGYRVTTTTETSTMENVNFLNVGVILKIVPRICHDNQVLLHVKPEVSKGEINPLTELPNSDTTTVETDVMLPDGRGMVIGGLIQEKDIENQKKVPILGDLWIVGRLFQQQTITKERTEYIITLVPHIVPDCMADNDRHAEEVLRTETPLLCGPLERVCRPWEPRLPDAFENPWRLRDHLPKRRQGERLGSDGNFYVRPGPGQSAPYYERQGRVESCPPQPGEMPPPGEPGEGFTPEPSQAAQGRPEPSEGREPPPQEAAHPANTYYR